MLKGIDVSHHQGKIDWNKVDVDFVIIRAGYGRLASQKDRSFDANMKGAIARGIPIGVYWYSYATSVTDVQREANACLEVIKPYKKHITLPVFFDQEYEPGILAQSKATRTAMCVRFIELIEAAGYKGGMYASNDWFMNKIDSSQLKKHPAWVAQYSSKCTYSGDNLWGWQYSSKGRMSGIAGNVDMNNGYFDLPKAKKSITEIAQEVIDGKWGNGVERKTALLDAGYSYSEVQKKVNELLAKPKKKSNVEIAKEVLQGKWGNGAERKKRLTEAGYDYNAVQKEVNKLL